MAEVRNKQEILKNHVTGFPKESDMELVDSSIKLEIPEGSNEVLLKNLYLSCDPYMRLKMTKSDASGIFASYAPGVVSLRLQNYYFFFFLWYFPLFVFHNVYNFT